MVHVYFFCGQANFQEEKDAVAVPRVVPKTKAVLRSALEELLKGPTEAERNAGLTSSFSGETADFLTRVSVTDGVATIDFSKRLGAMSNISTSSASQMLLLSVDLTVKRFKGIDRAIYRLEGDRGAWCEITQGAGCPEF
ncbi:MAG: GerMN domain-containing protein [Actinomycetota bacterium]